MKDTLERIRKEAVMSYWNYHPGIFLEGLSKSQGLQGISVSALLTNPPEVYSVALKPTRSIV
jgi:hypothetical protein